LSIIRSAGSSALNQALVVDIGNGDDARDSKRSRCITVLRRWKKKKKRWPPTHKEALQQDTCYDWARIGGAARDLIEMGCDAIGCGAADQSGAGGFRWAIHCLGI
jgi:hypothetical protein